MSIALDEANKAYASNEVPVGACIINDNGQVVATAHNTKEKDHDPCGHAEIKVIQKLSAQLESWRLTDYHLVVTLEPCLMCASALYNARLKSVIFGAYDPKGGFLSLGYDVHSDKRLNHQFDVLGGVNQFNCSKILSQFFKQKRKGHHKS
jgi:tRNA(adenine34) deaminase